MVKVYAISAVTLFIENMERGHVISTPIFRALS